MSRVLPFLILWIFIGCKNSNREILPLDKMKVVFLHQMMAEEMVNLHFANKDTTLNLDSIYITSFEKVLKLNKMDTTVFFKSLAYYKSDVDRYKELLDSTHAYANKLRAAAYEAKDSSKTERDKAIDENDFKRFQDIRARSKGRDSLAN